MSYSEVRSMVQQLHGKKIFCEINKGRNKIVKVPVIINQVYSSMFTIEPLEIVDLDRKSFSYSDVLCGDIKFL